MTTMRDMTCPHCGGTVRTYANPAPTVDVIIAAPGLGVALVRRRNEPPGWALPGGFVDYGESVEKAAEREALEETGLRVRLKELVGVWSAPERDPRLHTISTVFVAVTDSPEEISGGDDASEARFFSLDALPQALAFDHASILEDFAVRFAARYGV
ncbi:NUDIX hydrolase [Desulfovibrio sp. OttesenSCG-928-F20]|nr:NUDIX hydrolase [Desulfovibrio sp. OttesenSCG-928-M16]MDL2291159.1 NUDIX hydrolase [Desulfovibrio sp. OttesenSCG-928-F20]